MKKIENLTFEEFHWNIFNEFKSPYSNKLKVILKYLFNILFSLPLLILWIIFLPILILKILSIIFDRIFDLVEKIISKMYSKYISFRNKINPFDVVFSDDFLKYAKLRSKEKFNWKEVQKEMNDKFSEENKQINRNHKPVTSPTPPPSPQSYWTGKSVEEAKMKIGKVSIGKKWTDERKQKLSESQKKKME